MPRLFQSSPAHCTGDVGCGGVADPSHLLSLRQTGLAQFDYTRSVSQVDSLCVESYCARRVHSATLANQIDRLADLLPFLQFRLFGSWHPLVKQLFVGPQQRL